jgi:7-cyano-7-deazaguanine synthase in queuosine biosynthesis
VLYDQAPSAKFGSIGAAVKQVIRRSKFQPAPRAWDLLSIAFAVIAADFAGHRNKSPDGWTREFELDVAVADPAFWTTQAKSLEDLFGFLTTDRWQLNFMGDGFQLAPDRQPVHPSEDSIVLLSGGLDSLIGAIDLVGQGKRPFAVSQSVRGDEDKQDAFASLIGGGLNHLRLNHNAHVPEPEAMPSQRARSIVFFAYGVLCATSLARYHAGHQVVLNVCENGFISINPPLTDMRLGSLSTRTCHPVILGQLQKVLDAAGLRVHVTNPYQYKTKGEMLAECCGQNLLMGQAHRSTSCGRFKRYGYNHCGRCLPCLIRRAAFNRWGVKDRTPYKYKSLSKNDKEHARSDDVRAAAVAVADVKANGLDAWLGASLSYSLIDNKDELRKVAGRGLEELAKLLQLQKVR